MAGLKALIAFLPSLLYKLLAKTGMPQAAQDIVVHAVVVFVSAFAAQVIASSVTTFSWPTLYAAAVAGAAAGGSAVIHYLIGLVPNQVAPLKPKPPAVVATVPVQPPAAA